MNPSFEEVWSGAVSLPEQAERDEDIFATMQPYRVPYLAPTGTDAQMVKAYKRAHAWNVCEASNDMEMIYSRTICRKCMLHTTVCRTYGHDLKKYEAELKMHKTISQTAEINHNGYKQMDK